MLSKSMTFRYILFHKPYGVLSQFTSEGGHKSLADFNLPKDVYPAGRLDHDSEGLLLLTNDGGYIKSILEPSKEKQKTYWVQVEGIPTEEKLSEMKAGLKIEDYQTKPCEVKIITPEIEPRNPPIRERKNIPTTWLEVILHEGKNRQIRKMTAKIGYPTLRLIRISIHKYSLDFLKPGSWSETSKK